MAPIPFKGLRASKPHPQDLKDPENLYISREFSLFREIKKKKETLKVSLTFEK